MGYIRVKNPLILTFDPNFQRDIQVHYLYIIKGQLGVPLTMYPLGIL